MEKSRFEIEKEIRSRKLIKTEIKTKIKLIYDSKYNLMLKEENMQSNPKSARSDLINHWIQGFSFHDFETEVRRSRCDFFKFSQSILDFKHSSGGNESR